MNEKANEINSVVFPSPLEVDRFISKEEVVENFNPEGFRPLSRYIGLYLNFIQSGRLPNGEFPSPFEVYEFISDMKDVTNNFLETFPSPLGVYRFIS